MIIAWTVLRRSIEYFVLQTKFQSYQGQLMAQIFREVFSRVMVL